VNKKRKFFDLAERHINDYHKKSIVEFFGEDSKVKLNNLEYINSQKCILVDVTVVLSETINEETLNKEFVSALVQESMIYFYPEHSVKVMVGWDV
jgi:hypothetical protein